MTGDNRRVENGFAMAHEIAAGAAHAPANLVASALKRAAANTGVEFDYLLRTAKRESALNPAAKAATSSAAGLFQFIEQTWLEAVKKYGPAHGMADFASDIARDARGRFTVAADARRREILDLRFDPQKAAALAGELALENKSVLEKRLGRVVGAADLYTAHFLGANGAATMLGAGPDAAAADILPKAAAANRGVFYDGARARTVGEVLASIGQSMNAPSGAAKTPPSTAMKPSPETAVFAGAPAPVGAANEGVRAALAATLREGPAMRDISRARSPRTGAAAILHATSQTPGSEESRPLAATPTPPAIAVSAHRASSPLVDWRFSLDALLTPSKLLSPLALAVLQALDPTKLGGDKSDERR